MKSLAKSLIAIVVVLFALVVVIGPGGVVAGAEYPFGIGPWSSTGRYCHNIYDMEHFVEAWHHSVESRPTASQEATWMAYKNALTKSGPSVPRADFVAWFRGDMRYRTMQHETPRINKWWNQNCTDPVMEAPSSISHVWSGIGSHAAFAHYPKNVIRIEDYLKLIV